MKPGTYKAKAISAALGFTQNNSEQVAILFEMFDRDGISQGRMTWYGYFTDGTIDRTIDSLRATGWKGEDMSDLSSVGSEECEVVVAEERGMDGKLRTKVQWVNGFASRPALKDVMNESESKAFAARIADRLKAPRTQRGGGQRRQAIQEPEPNGSEGAVDDSDVPF